MIGVRTKIAIAPYAILLLVVLLIADAEGLISLTGGQARARPLPRGLSFTNAAGCRPAADWRSSRLDPRVRELLRSAAGRYRVRVSCLHTGHTKFVRGTRRVSNHFVWRAVDIDRVAGRPVGPGNPVAKRLALAVGRGDLGAHPSEVGSPWGFAGRPWFSDAGHQDHLHVGFAAAAPTGIPRAYLAAYRAAGRGETWRTRAGRGYAAWSVLAAVGKVESDHGRSRLPGVGSGVNSAGCCAGPMQFNLTDGPPSTWQRHGRGDVYAAADAIPAAARKLRADGARRDLDRAIYAYNHSWAYVADVKRLARTYQARRR